MIENYSKRDGKIIDINKKALENIYINKKNDCIILEGRVLYDCVDQLKIIIKDISDFYSEIVNTIELEKDYKFDKKELRETIKTVIYLKVINYAIFFKRNEFKKEEEYRIAILVNENILEENIKFRENRNGSNLKIPYIEVNIDSKYLKVKSAKNIK